MYFSVATMAGFILALSFPLAWLADDAGYTAEQLISRYNLEVADTPVRERADWQPPGMTITATRASKREGPEFVSRVDLPEELPELAAEADVIVNALPLTDATHGLFDAALFSKMKPTALFINVGRGGTVVTDDLVAALKNGTIAGAGLDVTDPEPLPRDHALWQAPNVIITPHIATRADIDHAARWQVVRENLKRYVNGERMLSVVDPERGY